MSTASAKTSDTIAAIATAPGRGGVGIVRVSGPRALAIGQAVLQRGDSLPPRHALFTPFHDDDGSVLDQGLAIFFQGPHSFTGEDVLELQGHGGPVVLDLLLRRVLALGARLARPGEFSERAFLNDKLDLAQAEAIADLIEAGSADAARSAMRSLSGVFSQKVQALVEALITLRLHVEAAIDFPEEEIDFLGDGRIAADLDAVIAQLERVQAEARQGALLREGMRVVIAGRPNAGKSSLLNALAGFEAAIVTDIAGTTRDVLREQIQIDACRCTSSTPPACARPAMWSSRKACGARCARWKARTACCLSMTPAWGRIPSPKPRSFSRPCRGRKNCCWWRTRATCCLTVVSVSAGAATMPKSGSRPVPGSGWTCCARR